MQARWLGLLVATILVAAQGCAGTAATREASHPSDVMLGMLDRHLTQLNANIDDLDKRIAGLQRMPETTDSTISEVRALDIAGWQLHQRQWTLQRDHLRFARAQLQRAKANPGDKPPLLEEWNQHEQEYEAALDGFRQQRHELERKRLQVEAQLIQRDLR